jgi:hypothetical protein
MKTILFLLTTTMLISLHAQHEIKCEVRVDNQNMEYTSLIGENASKTFFKMEGVDMILLNLADKGTYSLMPEELLAIKMRQDMLDTLEVCNCTFVKTGSKKTILGYSCDEYIQKCTSPKGASEVNIWYAGSLNINSMLISPLRGYIANSSTRPKGFPLLHEGKLSNGGKVKFEVISILNREIKASEFLIPEEYTIIEY